MAEASSLITEYLNATKQPETVQLNCPIFPEVGSNEEQHEILSFGYLGVSMLPWLPSVLSIKEESKVRRNGLQTHGCLDR